MNNFKPRIEVNINFIDYVDEIAMGNVDIIQNMIVASEAVVKSGGIVKWIRTYQNADPQVIGVFKSEEEIKAWKNRLKNMIIQTPI